MQDFSLEDSNRFLDQQLRVRIKGRENATPAIDADAT
jgi:hypothetical protein